MSVHGEYARALGGVRECLLAPGTHATRREAWLAALDEAAVSQGRDLTTAALGALAALAQIESELGGKAAGAEAGAEPAASHASRADADHDAGDPALLAACEHLRAHCRAILGDRSSRDGMPRSSRPARARA